VLVVDDQEETREMFAWCLRAAGWSVAEAGDGEQALALAALFRPHAIVVDLGLPTLDGLEATRRLRQDPATASSLIVVCTAADPKQSEQRAREAGCDAFVSKPFWPDQLQALLEEMLARKVEPLV
jgi:two-component system cell cycle response regulator DivK